MYKLSTLSRKMVLKLSRACGFYRGLWEIAFYRFPNNGLSDSVAYDNTHTCLDNAVPDNSASQPLFTFSPPPCVFFSDFYCPRQPRAFMCLISCKITASYFLLCTPQHVSIHPPPLRIPTLMGAKRCKLAEREGLLYTHCCGYLCSLFIIVIIINAQLYNRRERRGRDRAAEGEDSPVMWCLLNKLLFTTLTGRLFTNMLNYTPSATHSAPSQPLICLMPHEGRGGLWSALWTMWWRAALQGPYTQTHVVILTQ